MDLRGLMKGEPTAGRTRGRQKEERKDARKEAYKKPGRAAASSSESRTLRTIQVQTKRVQERSEKLSKARQLEPTRKAVEMKENGQQRMSRKDRLEEYRREKLELKEKLKKKAFVPFRAGVYHPEKKIKALPPVPQSRNVVARTPLDRMKPNLSKQRSSRTAQPQSATSSKVKEVVTRSGKTARSERTGTPRGGRKLLNEYKNKTQSPLRKSFAPRNFQFSVNMKIPQPQEKSKKQEDSVDSSMDTQENTGTHIEHGNNENRENTNTQKVEEEGLKETEKRVDDEGDQRGTENVPKTPKRRSRRISGVQPDLSLTPAMLSVTPARRAKERSVSRERRSKSCGVCPDSACRSSHTSVLPLPALEEVQEEKKVEEVEEVAPSVEAVTPVKDEETVATPMASTARRRRRVRHGSMKVIAETNEEQDAITPVSQLISGISRTNIQSDEKEEGFKTPMSSRAMKKLKLGELQVESPLSSVSTVRGSSKRKRKSPEAASLGVASLFEGLEGSPLLAKLEAKLSSNEEITEEDFAEGPVTKQIKLDIDFDKMADDVEEVSGEKEDKIVEEKNQIAEDSSEPRYDIAYFRGLLSSETARLTSLCNAWEEKLEQNLSRVEEEVQGEIRSVIGQGRLVMAERFAQFSGLVDNCEFKRGEKETTTTDLRGFWEMIYFQVEDVDRKFQKLGEIEANNWKEIIPRPKPALIKKKPAKKAGKVVKPSASSGLKAMIAAKRKAASGAVEESSQDKSQGLREMMAQKRAEMIRKKEEEKSLLSTDNLFDGGFFQVVSPVRSSPQSSPKVATPRGVGDKLRRSVLAETTRRRSGVTAPVSALLSPFISQAARRSLSESPRPPTNLLLDVEDSHVKAPDLSSPAETSRTPTRRSSRVRTPIVR